MVCFLALIAVEILLSRFVKRDKRLKRKAGIWFIKMPERFAPETSG